MDQLDNPILAAYLVAAILFILGIKKLGRPRTSVRGNQLCAAGMLLAVASTLATRQIADMPVIIAGVTLGSLIGVLAATRVRMTAIPELVALFNGFGGGASVAVAVSSHLGVNTAGSNSDAADAVSATVLKAASSVQTNLAVTLAVIIGAVTFTGSMLAFLKLSNKLQWQGFKAIQILSIALACILTVLGSLVVINGDALWLWLLILPAALLGITMVVPIGGADMPVVIALLNSLSGLAAVAAGFALSNPLLIIAGALVGASGLILTQVMCVAMNRSLPVVLFHSSPSNTQTADSLTLNSVYEGKIHQTSAEEVAILLETATRVIIVPGYGLAVAQAQHAVRDLAKKLQNMDIEVIFAIHPVAGRMPGHMNVLLAEAEIDYKHLLVMDDANHLFGQTDVTIVLGANDVVNLSAREETSSSPIAGMPILDVDKSKVVVVVKRSLSPGFAGIPNPLFTSDNTLMFFGDGRKSILKINAALQEI